MAADDQSLTERVSSQADERRHPQPVRIGVIYRQALATYFARFPMVAGAAVVVFVPLALLMTAITIWGARYNDGRPDEIGLLVFLATLVGTSVILFGSAFYAGLLDKVVGEHQHGHHRASVLEVMRTLPYKRLLSAEILLSIAVTAGMMLFVVPGLLLFTLFALVGPIITIEHRTTIGGFRRSMQLIRPVILSAFVAVTLPVIVEHSLVHAIVHAILHQPSFLVVFVLTGFAAATVGAFVGLVEVTLAFALIRREVASSPELRRRSSDTG
ncbi:MAG: hypothetical protein AB7N70_15150 [Dehalococcoidia bacterium]